MKKLDDKFWKLRLSENIAVIREIEGDASLIESISKSANIIIDAFSNGNKLLICGNGGSAADAQHLAAELVGRFYKERRPLDAEALSVNTSCLTAIGNDYSFDNVFSRQIEAKARKGDVLLAISTSGNSKNITAACETAKNHGVTVIGMQGNNQNSGLSQLVDVLVQVPSKDTPRIQEAHILIGHMMCEYIENTMFREMF